MQHFAAFVLDWNDKRNYPVRDHDHTKPKNNYRGAAHRFCNLEKLVESVKIGGGESFDKLKNEYPSDYKDLTRKGVFL